jgi:Transposase domain (DUF772)
MRLIRHLQHWLGGSGPRLRVADIVPTTNSIRQWADTFPWAEMVEAIEQSVARRFPKRSSRGRRPVPTRVLLALELLKHAVGASDEAICERLCTDVAVMYACGIADVQFGSQQAHFVLPETLAQFRSRLDEASSMHCWPSRRRQPWTRASSAQRISSSIPFRRHRAASALRMPPRGIQRKKSPPARRPPHGTVHRPSHHAKDARRAAAARIAQDYAPLWAPMPGPGYSPEFSVPCFCHVLTWVSA